MRAGRPLSACPNAPRRPRRRLGAQRRGAIVIAGGVGERCVHEQSLREQRIGIGIVVAESCFQQFAVVVEDAQRLVAIAPLEQNVGQPEGLKLLDLGIERDLFFHQPLGLIEIAPELGERKSDSLPRRRII